MNYKLTRFIREKGLAEKLLGPKGLLNPPLCAKKT